MLNLQQLPGDVACLEGLLEIVGHEAEGYYYFDWVATLIFASYAFDQEPLEVVLNASMRDAEVARQLKEPRRALARFEKVLVGVESTALEGETLVALELPEKQLVAANWWLRYQLETRLTPWSPAGLAAAVQNYTRAWVNCWENIRLDGGGNTQLVGQRKLFWADQKRFIGVLRKALVP